MRDRRIHRKRGAHDECVDEKAMMLEYAKVNPRSLRIEQLPQSGNDNESNVEESEICEIASVLITTRLSIVDCFTQLLRFDCKYLHMRKP